jgi:hypothetical protein
LLTAFDLSSLRDVLSEELPAMHVRNAVFSLYCDDTRRELEPFFCLRDGVPVDPGVARFPATQLIPPGIYPSEHHMSFVWPLAANLQHFGVELTEDNRKQLFVPEMFAHGYLTLSDGAEVSYQVGEFYTPGCERGIRYNDPALKIKWPIEVKIVSPKDASWPDFVPDRELTNVHR